MTRTLPLLLVVGALACSDDPGDAIPDAGAPDDAAMLDAAIERDAGAYDASPTDAYVPPMFEGTASALPADVRDTMTGVSWHAGCPVGLDDLSLLELTHWGFDGEVHHGQMVVAASVADDVLGAFEALFDARFPIDKIRLVDEYDADDDRSMADNNTSAFNCRMVTGGTTFSEHSYGTAIDIDPVQNPYVRGTTVLPPAGDAYLDRTDVRDGMIVDPGPAVAAFDAIGWGWGGEWSSLKDYQHFSESGR